MGYSETFSIKRILKLITCMLGTKKTHAYTDYFVTLAWVIVYVCVFHVYFNKFNYVGGDI